MAIRLVVQMRAIEGRGAELAAAAAERCRIVESEDGCEQFEIFRSALDPDKFTLLIQWRNQDALDAHNLLASKQPADVWTTLVSGTATREDYTLNRTR